MPEVRYARSDPRRASLEERFRRLRLLYHELLLRTNGDVEEALRLLEVLGRRHRLFDGRLGIRELRRLLEAERSVTRDERGRLRLTRRGERALRAESLESVFGALQQDRAGQHGVPREGEGRERLPETRPWNFGDSLSLLDATGSLCNAIRRCGGADLRLAEEDLRVHETEQLAACATVLLVDVSHSMILYGEDRITPAKRVALALAELITTRYPKDSLDVVLFGDEARRVPLDQLPYVGVGPFHTNTRAGLQLARDILRRSRGRNRRIVVLTDGKPSALTESDGRLYKNPFGLDERIVNKTLEEAVACRRHGIPVTTFMLTDDPVLIDFVDRFTRINRGRAYFASPEKLGFVLVDYVQNRRRRVV